LQTINAHYAGTCNSDLQLYVLIKLALCRLRSLD